MKFRIDPKTGEVIAALDSKGHEVPDPTPLELPAGFKRPETLAEQVQRLVRTSVSQYAAMTGQETFEEAEDFEVDDESFDPHTPYEVDFDPILNKEIAPADFRDPEKREYYKRLYLQAERNAIRAEARQDAINEAYQAAKKANIPKPGQVKPAPSPEKTDSVAKS